MIKSFEITNYLGESIVLDLANPYTTGLAIKSVKGLNPVKADIKTTDLALLDGSYFNSARAQSRNIVFEFIFLPAPTIEDTRERVYKYFPIKKNLTIKVNTDNKTLYTEGYVESNEVNIFSNEESTQISIICPNAYFTSEETNNSVLSCLDKVFEFPFEKDTSDENTIVFGNVKTTNELSILYEGTVETGFDMIINFLGPVSNIILYDLTTDETMIIYTDLICDIIGIDSILQGDRIYISTHKGNKYIYYDMNGSLYNILGCIDINSGWFQLQKGYNRLGLKLESGYENVEISITANLLFEGV